MQSPAANSPPEACKSEFQVGDLVSIGSTEIRGTVRFAGPTKFAAGEWLGVELSERCGKNNGTVQGYRYFECEQNYGLFLRPGAVKKLSSPAEVSSPAPNSDAQAGARRSSRSRIESAGGSPAATPPKTASRPSKVQGSGIMSPSIGPGNSSSGGRQSVARRGSRVRFTLPGEDLELPPIKLDSDSDAGGSQKSTPLTQLGVDFTVGHGLAGSTSASSRERPPAASLTSPEEGSLQRSRVQPPSKASLPGTPADKSLQKPGPPGSAEAPTAVDSAVQLAADASSNGSRVGPQVVAIDDESDYEDDRCKPSLAKSTSFADTHDADWTTVGQRRLSRDGAASEQPPRPFWAPRPGATSSFDGSSVSTEDWRSRAGSNMEPQSESVLLPMRPGASSSACSGSSADLELPIAPERSLTSSTTLLAPMGPERSLTTSTALLASSAAEPSLKSSSAVVDSADTTAAADPGSHSMSEDSPPSAALRPSRAETTAAFEPSATVAEDHTPDSDARLDKLSPGGVSTPARAAAAAKLEPSAPAAEDGALDSRSRPEKLSPAAEDHPPNFGAVPEKPSPVTASTPGGDEAAAALEQLAQATEDHDTERLRHALHKSKAAGVAWEELESAHRILNFEVQQALLLELEGVRAAVASLRRTVEAAEAHASLASQKAQAAVESTAASVESAAVGLASARDEALAACESKVDDLRGRFETSLWQGLERRVEEVVNQAATHAARELVAQEIRAQLQAQARSEASETKHCSFLTEQPQARSDVCAVRPCSPVAQAIEYLPATCSEAAVSDVTQGLLHDSSPKRFALSSFSNAATAGSAALPASFGYSAGAVSVSPPDEKRCPQQLVSSAVRFSLAGAAARLAALPTSFYFSPGAAAVRPPARDEGLRRLASSVVRQSFEKASMSSVSLPSSFYYTGGVLQARRPVQERCHRQLASSVVRHSLEAAAVRSVAMPSSFVRSSRVDEVILPDRDGSLRQLASGVVAHALKTVATRSATLPTPFSSSAGAAEIRPPDKERCSRELAASAVQFSLAGAAASLAALPSSFYFSAGAAEVKPPDKERCSRELASSTVHLSLAGAAARLAALPTSFYFSPGAAEVRPPDKERCSRELASSAVHMSLAGAAARLAALPGSFYFSPGAAEFRPPDKEPCSRELTASTVRFSLARAAARLAALPTSFDFSPGAAEVRPPARDEGLQRLASSVVSLAASEACSSLSGARSWRTPGEETSMRQLASSVVRLSLTGASTRRCSSQFTSGVVRLSLHGAADRCSRRVAAGAVGSSSVVVAAAPADTERYMQQRASDELQRSLDGAGARICSRQLASSVVRLSLQGVVKRCTKQLVSSVVRLSLEVADKRGCSRQLASSVACPSLQAAPVGIAEATCVAVPATETSAEESLPGIIRDVEVSSVEVAAGHCVRATVARAQHVVEVWSFYSARLCAQACVSRAAARALRITNDPATRGGPSGSSEETAAYLAEVRARVAQLEAEHALTRDLDAAAASSQAFLSDAQALVEGARASAQRLEAALAYKAAGERAAVLKLQAVERGRQTRRSVALRSRKVGVLQAAIRRWIARRQLASELGGIARAVLQLCTRRGAWAQAFDAASEGSSSGISSRSMLATALARSQLVVSTAQVAALWDAYVESADSIFMDVRTFCRLAEAVAEGPCAACEFADLSPQAWEALGRQSSAAARQESVAEVAENTAFEAEAPAAEREARIEEEEAEEEEAPQAECEAPAEEEEEEEEGGGGEEQEKEEAVASREHPMVGCESVERRATVLPTVHEEGLDPWDDEAWASLFDEVSAGSPDGLGEAAFCACVALHVRLTAPQVRSIWKGYATCTRRDRMSRDDFCAVARAAAAGSHEAAEFADVSLEAFEVLGVSGGQEAATKLQASVRGRMARRSWSEHRTATMRIQRLVRHWLGQKTLGITCRKPETRFFFVALAMRHRYRTWASIYDRAAAEQGGGAADAGSSRGHGPGRERLTEAAFTVALPRAIPGLHPASVGALWSGFEQGTGSDRMDLQTFCSLAQALVAEDFDLDAMVDFSNEESEEEEGEEEEEEDEEDEDDLDHQESF